MQILIPLLAAVSQAIGILLDRFIISRLRPQVLAYLFYSHLFLTMITLLLQPSWGGVDPGSIATEGWWKLWLAILVLAPCWNYLYFKAVRHEKALYVENVFMLAPVLSIVGAWLIVPADFKVSVLAALIVACACIVWGYKKKRGFVFDRHILLLLGSMVLFATEGILVSELLKSNAVKPVTLYVSRVVLMTVLFGSLAKANGKLKISKRALCYVAVSAGVAATMMISMFYGFRDSGIVVTSMMLLLTPAFIYKGSVLFLHEKVSKHKLYAFMGMIVAVICAMFFNAQ